MMDLYVLIGKDTFKVDNFEEWAEEHYSKPNQVQSTTVEGLVPVLISTVFLGVDHNTFLRALTGKEHPPALFETMVFGGAHDEYQERYATYEEAEIGHERIVEMVTEIEEEIIKMSTETPNVDQVLAAIMDAMISNMKANKPNDRTEKDRVYAVMITELQKAYAYFVTFADIETERGHYFQGIDVMLNKPITEDQVFTYTEGQDEEPDSNEYLDGFEEISLDEIIGVDANGESLQSFEGEDEDTVENMFQFIDEFLKDNEDYQDPEEIDDD